MSIQILVQKETYFGDFAKENYYMQKLLGLNYDENTGLYYLRARYYDPTTGRFTQQDPAEDGYNWYVYGNQNPALYVDLNGEVAMIAGIAITGEMLTLIGTGVVVLGYLASKAFIRAFTEAVNLGNTIRNSIIYAKGKAKAPTPPSKLKNGDKIKTPDTHSDEFKKNKDGSYTHKKTKWNFRKDTLHKDGHWDASPSGKNGDYINVNADGTIR